MKCIEFDIISYHTPLSAEVRDKISKAYSRGDEVVILKDISLKDTEVLYGLGYRIKITNKKVEVKL